MVPTSPFGVDSSQEISGPLRRGSGILEEAAKRAQIAVITRDMNEVGL